MPYRDGTGPNGQGPLTGRGAGNCAGQGRTRGFRRQGLGYNANINSAQANSWLQTQLDNLQTAIQRLTERLDESKRE